MGVAATILDALIFGVRDVLANAVAFPRRTALNFIGATLVDDPTNGWTLVTIPGVLGTGLPKAIDAGSAPIAVGQYVVPTAAGTVTLATATSVLVFNGVLGIALAAGSAGATISVAIEDWVPNSITGLGAGTESRVKLNTATGRPMRVTTPDYVPGDIPLGDCDTAGNLLQSRGDIVQVNALTLQGATVPSCTSMTTGNGLYATGAGAFGLSAINLAGGAGWVSGLLPTTNLGRRVVRAVTTTYTVDSSGHDDIIEASTGGGAFNLTLPDPTTRQLPIDVYGDFATNNLTVKRHAAETIGGLAADFVCHADGGRYRFVPDGTNWLLGG